jgi:hypothetical protein
MKPRIARHRAHAFALAATLVLLAAVVAAPAGARPAASPAVDVQSFAGLAPDARSITVQVLASCPERWSVIEAVVTVSQPQASGQAAFPLTCIGSLRVFTVTVRSAAGTFALADARVSASVVINRGKTASAQDSELVQVQPTVSVALAGTARLQNGGAAVVTEVTVACPAGTTGLPSTINISQQGRTTGNGSYTPVCDGAPHTFSVTVQAAQGVYQAGSAQALTFANVEHGGDAFVGIDDGEVQITP